MRLSLKDLGRRLEGYDDKNCIKREPEVLNLVHCLNKHLPVKNIKSSARAKVSPRHCLFPMEYGIRCSVFWTLPLESRNRSGRKVSPSPQWSPWEDVINLTFYKYFYVSMWKQYFFSKEIWLSHLKGRKFIHATDTSSDIWQNPYPMHSLPRSSPMHPLS